MRWGSRRVVSGMAATAVVASGLLFVAPAAPSAAAPVGTACTPGNGALPTDNPKIGALTTVMSGPQAGMKYRDYTFSASCDWTVPTYVPNVTAPVTLADIIVIGGGGGGGGGLYTTIGSTKYFAGGNGGGGAASTLVENVAVSGVIPVVVGAAGAGGAGGTTTGSAGGDGGASSFNGMPSLTVSGGKGGEAVVANSTMNTRGGTSGFGVLGGVTSKFQTVANVPAGSTLPAGSWVTGGAGGMGGGGAAAGFAGLGPGLGTPDATTTTAGGGGEGFNVGSLNPQGLFYGINSTYGPGGGGGAAGPFVTGVGPMSAVAANEGGGIFPGGGRGGNASQLPVASTTLGAGGSGGAGGTWDSVNANIGAAQAGASGKAGLVLVRAYMDSAPKPAFSAQPASVTKLVGETATFTATVTGGMSATKTGVWQMSLNNGATWSNITAPTTAGTTMTYTTSALTLTNDNTKFRVAVTYTQAVGFRPAVGTSNVATLNVTLPVPGPTWACPTGTIAKPSAGHLGNITCYKGFGTGTTWTVPPGVTKVDVVLYGGGGGGGTGYGGTQGTSTVTFGGSGGAGGEVKTYPSTAVQAGDVITLTTAGAGGLANGPGKGFDGGASTGEITRSGTTVLALSAAGGTGGASATAAGAGNGGGTSAQIDGVSSTFAGGSPVNITATTGYGAGGAGAGQVNSGSTAQAGGTPASSINPSATKAGSGGNGYSPNFGAFVMDGGMAAVGAGGGGGSDSVPTVGAPGGSAGTIFGPRAGIGGRMTSALGTAVTTTMAGPANTGGGGGGGGAFGTGFQSGGAGGGGLLMVAMDALGTADAPVVSAPASVNKFTGEQATFSVTATATGTLTYQWQVSTDNGTTWSNVTSGTGGTTSSYTTGVLSNGDNNAKYRVQVTNTLPAPVTFPNTTTSSAATLGVVAGPDTPPAPTTVVGDGKVTAIVAPASTGSTPTSYVVTAYDGNTSVGTCTVTSPATSCQVTGLTNGTAYTFTSTAYLGQAPSPASPESAPVTPCTVPNAPTGLVSTSSGGALNVSFTQAPGSDGGSPITNYQYSLDGGVTWTTLSPSDDTSPVTIPNLTNGTAYAVTLRAVNDVGVGAASTAAAAATPKDVPGAPTSLIATPKNGEAQIAFTAGATNGSPITNYKYSLDGITWTPLSPDDTTSPVTIPGLANGTDYTIQLKAVNAIGDSLASTSVSVTPQSMPPSAPTGLTATAQPGALQIGFTAPASDGGAAISNYEYSLDGGITWTVLNPDDSTSPVTVPNLTNGTPYDVQLRAVNLKGSGAASATVSGTPIAAPGAPTSLVATPKNGEAQIAFTPGADNGSTITNYKYSVNSGAWTALSPDDTTSPVTIPGLNNNTLYTIRLMAVNAVGDGAISAPVSVTPVPLPPSAPTITTAARGDGQATISFTAPSSNGGDAISNYQYSTDGGVTWTDVGSTSSPFTVTGLSNGNQYSFTLRAVNSAGSGSASAPATVTPAGVPGAPTFIQSMPRNGAVEFTFTPGGDNGSPITNYKYTLDDGQTWVPLSPPDASSPVTITGLTNGQAYYINLRAVNAVGDGASFAAPYNSQTLAHVPYGTPAAPTGLSTSAGTSQATVTFNPGSNGGSPITNYQYSLDGGTTWIAISPATGAVSSVTVPGLDQKITYNIKLRAINAAGEGAESVSASVTITQTANDTVPAAPTTLVATASDRSAIIAFTAGADGGQVITDYEYCLDACTSWTALGDNSSPVTIPGLANGQTYAVQLRAVNLIGPGTPSTPVTVTPAVVPAAPTNLDATAGNGSAQIDFTTGYNGGSPVTNYKYCLSNCGSPGAWTALDDTTSPVTIPGLSNNTQYTIKLRAVNAIGESVDSGSVTVTPVPLRPSAPTGLVATAGDDTASVSFTPPTSDGGGTISNYQYSLDGGVTWTALSPDDTTSPVTIPNLVNGTAYSITLRAVNSTGGGAASSTVSVTPVGPPNEPTSLVATSGNASAQIAFTAGAANGSPITNYKYSLDGTTWTALSPDDITSPVTIPGLTNGTPYTIQLKAVNAVGDSLGSTSVSVTPMPLPPAAPTGLVAVPQDGSALVSFTPGSDGGGAISNYEYSLDGGITWTSVSPANASSPVLVTNLANGTPYSIQLRGVNASGSGASSGAVAVTPAGAPFAPTDLAATNADGSVTIAFTPGANNGSPITKYQYTLDGVNWSDVSSGGASSPVTINGLTNGVDYVINLRAVNDVGVGSAAQWPVNATPAAVPGAPAMVGATPLDSAAEIVFNPPISDGGAPITNYQYCLSNCGQSSSWISLSPADAMSPVNIPNLVNGTTYNVKLRAINSTGVGAASDPVSVTPLATPDAPTVLIANSASGQAVISFVPGADNGSAITEYLYSLDGGTEWTAVNSTSSPVTVSGLTNGTTYTVMLRARNGEGVGAISVPIAVTPVAPPTPPTPGPTPGPGPGPTPTPTPVPIPAPLDPGDSELTINGISTPVKVDPNASDNGLNVEGDRWTMDLDGLGPDGKPLDLGPGGVLRVQVGRDVRTEGTGFKPGSDVGLFLNPPVVPSVQSAGTTWFRSLVARVGSATSLAMVRVDGQGSFQGAGTLPRDITHGTYVLQAVGFGPGGETRALSLGVLVEGSIVLNQGVRTRGKDRAHDRITTTGATTGFEPGARLTPYIKYTGQKTFTKGKASIVVATDGTFRWTRLIRRDKGVTGYVAYQDVTSNQITWVKLT